VDESEEIEERNELEEGRRGNDVIEEEDERVEKDDSGEFSNITTSLDFPDPKAREIYVSTNLYVFKINDYWILISYDLDFFSHVDSITFQI
jgi:hypothetical protein